MLAGNIDPAEEDLDLQLAHYDRALPSRRCEHLNAVREPDLRAEPS